MRAGPVNSDRCTVGSSGSELHNRPSLRRSYNSVRLRCNQTLMIDNQKNHRFYKLRLNHRSSDRENRFMRKNRRTFRHCPNITGKPKVSEVFQKFFAENTFPSEKFYIFFRKLQIFKVIDNLFDPCHNGVAASVRDLSEEHIEICDILLHIT